MGRLTEKTSSEAQEKILAIGGQAVIEGVMMRSPERLATAVRRTSGRIELKIQEYRSLFQRHRWLNIPVIRGAITLFEVMILGIQHLNFSADMAMQDAEAMEEATKPSKKRKKKKKRGLSTFSAVVSVSIALLVGLTLFFAFPLFATTHLFSIEREALAFNLVAGTIRIALFLGYLMLISFMKDIRRLFQYHGAEHKTIFAFEKGLDLTVANIRRQPRLHPRCGTSFLVMVMLVSLLFFALVDTAVMAATGRMSLWIRLGTHLPLVPIVAGLSYEAIKASARRPDHPLVRIFIAPGLALQRITTSEPDDSMIEVAIVALKAARGEDVSAWLQEEPAAVNHRVAVS